MELTNRVIELGYKHAWIYLKRLGRRDVSYQDLAHDAFLKLVRIQEPPVDYVEHKIRWVVRGIWREFYTNKTTRKHNVMLKAGCLPFGLETRDPDTVEAKGTFAVVLGRLCKRQPTQSEIITNLMTGKTIQELAARRGTSTQAVHELKMKAQKEITRIFADVA